jgi:hypothetical protein
MMLFKKKRKERQNEKKDDGWCATHANELALLFSPCLYPVIASSFSITENMGDVRILPSHLSRDAPKVVSL